MRILFLTAQLPDPPHAGGALRVNGLMRAVHAAGHEVHLLSFADDNRLALSRPALDQFCTSADAAPPPQRSLPTRLRDLLLTDQPDMQRRFESPLYAAKLADLLARHAFDLIQIESLEMATYLPVIRRAQSKATLLYDAFNAEYDLQRSIYAAEKRNPRRLPGAVYSYLQWRRLIHFERDVCHAVDHVIAVSDADADAFRRLAPDSAVSVVPNGIDVQLHAQPDDSLDLGQHALVFTGSMGYRPNVDAAMWFADHILDRVRAHVPDARFFVVGHQPHRRLAALHDREDVQVTGWVPDVNPFLHAAAVYVVPLRMGSGTRLKLLQAMAAGQAVVSTRIGAQGLTVQDGVQLRLADTAEDFARAVVELLGDPVEREAMGQRGAGYVAAHYDWPVIAPLLLRVYDRVRTENTSLTSREESHEQKTTTPA